MIGPKAVADFEAGFPGASRPATQEEIDMALKYLGALKEIDALQRRLLRLSSLSDEYGNYRENLTFMRRELKEGERRFCEIYDTVMENTKYE